MPGWKGNIDRFAAEKNLENQRVGTYVLHRGRSWTQLGKGVEIYLVTIKEANKKISGRMFVHTKLGWTLYRDNTDLNDKEYYRYYDSFEEALKELVPEAKIPVH